jgi:hypothetical protein
MRRSAALLLLALAAACAHGKRGANPGAEPVTLCVANETSGYGNIVARVGPMRIDVQPGETVCRELRGVPPGSVNITAVSTGGGLAGPIGFRDVLVTGPGDCWRWTIRGLRDASLFQCGT